VVAAVALGVFASAASASTVFSKLPGEMFERRYSPAVGVLPNGKVLVAGGYNETGRYLRTAEFFSPATGGFENAPNMTAERDETGFVVLPGGSVFIAGGWDEAGGKGHPLKSAELFNPLTGSFEPVAGEMTTERDGPAAALLSNGKVLIVGGTDKAGTDLKTAELYDSATQTFEKIVGELGTGRYEPGAVTLPNGKVLIAGGSIQTIPTTYLSTAELFNPETNTFEPLVGAAHELVERRDEVGALLLPSGKALIVGGAGPSGVLKTIETFNSETNTFELLPTQLTEPRTGPGLVQFANGALLVLGGYNGTSNLKSGEETPPVTTTTLASSITASAATLNGATLPEAPSTAYFQYGTTTGYGSSTTHQLLGLSPTPFTVSAPVSALAPAATYHYRLVDEQFGTTYGQDQSFTTPAIPVAAPSGPLKLKSPIVANVRQSQSTWREGNKLAHFSKRKPPVGTSFSFSLDERATVAFTFTHLVGGRETGHKCVAQTNKNRHRRSCKRTVTAGTMTFTGHAGSNTLAFQGRMSRSTRLNPGSYTLGIQATNAGGIPSIPAYLRFTIVK
jgi:hypothetical protein